jgi:cytosine/uracil/thiamine/allantoin permease
MIDPRAPRFTAGVTAVLLLVAIGLSLAHPTSAATPAFERLSDPAFLLFTAISLLFLWGATAGVKRHPFGCFFRVVIRPRLAPPAELEDPKPPTFAQLVGFVVTIVGVLLAAVGVPAAIVVTGSLAFVAAFLNSVFGYCIGCQLYLLLMRAAPVSRRS